MLEKCLLYAHGLENAFLGSPIYQTQIICTKKMAKWYNHIHQQLFRILKTSEWEIDSVKINAYTQPRPQCGKPKKSIPEFEVLIKHTKGNLSLS